MSTNAQQTTADVANAEKRICGVIMPISECDGCGPNHWLDVLEIIGEGLKDTPFTPNIVSNSLDSGLIHKSIVQNLFANEIVICDVSGRNPNVMFELGLRLAFNKATIILKDDKTPYSFDTGVMKHLEYPRDLHYHKILAFKRELGQMVNATLEASRQPGYSPFLKHFGVVNISELPREEANILEAIRAEFRDVQMELRSLANSVVDRAPSSGRLAGDLHSNWLQFVGRPTLIDGLLADLTRNRNFPDILIERLAPEQMNIMGLTAEAVKAVRSLSKAYPQLSVII